MRLRVSVRGAVQGVGFRPFVYRLAKELGLAGWVNNSPQGVAIEVEGSREVLENFILRLGNEKPPRSYIQSLEHSWLDPVGYTNFEIRESDTAGEIQAVVLPDIATCPECLQEVFDPANRRYRYPFTNCTNCGPRFSIIEALPYDRANTTMKIFRMCPACQAEYDEPLDRRFHAQPNACPVCGPHLEFWDGQGHSLAEKDEALRKAAAEIKNSAIVAVKGLGGFHLMVAAGHDEAVRRLRERKHREEKPLALMFPTLEQVQQHCSVSALEERLLRSPGSPIVLLQRQLGCGGLSPLVAPGNPYLGVMLPYTPLHHLFLGEIGSPVVATSGNLSDEPICIDEKEALRRLAGIADFFLVHNRPIVRHVDDSIVRVMAGREMVLRRARGYAPLPIELKSPVAPTLAVGGHLKNTVALAVKRQVFISQHIGDLETAEALGAFRRVIKDFQQLYATAPQVVAADTHPEYLSTKFAQETGLPLVSVQHHFAHVLGCMAENDLEPPVFGVSWDGTGYGLDGSVWGGEFVMVTREAIRRAGHLRTFRLPGGEAAIREPRRVALGLLHELFGDGLWQMNQLQTLQAFSQNELSTLRTMLERKVNAPITSSAGRIFDAVASILGQRQQLRFEGQAAMELEFALGAATGIDAGFYPFGIEEESGSPEVFVVDWEPMVTEIIRLAGTLAPPVTGTEQRQAIGEVSAKFHNTLAEIIVAAAKRAGEPRVLLTGGCFQNKYLTEETIRRLEQAGFRPYWHQRVPPNDGGIALGQIVAASRMCQ